MSTALPEEVADRLRRAIRERLLPRFGPDIDRAQSAAARELDVHPSTINRFLHGKGPGGSYRLLQSVAQTLNESEEAFLYGPTRGTVRHLRELPGFDAAMAEARARIGVEHPGLSVTALERAADATLAPEPRILTGALLIQVALHQQRSDAPPRRIHKTKR